MSIRGIRQPIPPRTLLGNVGHTTAQAVPISIQELASASRGAIGTGSVTSIDVSGGTTGLTTSGGAITTTGTITLAGTLNATHGGTGQTVYAVGDILYASTTTALSKLADVAAGSVLISGGVGVAPAWSTTPTFVGTNITGTAASLTAGRATVLATARTIGGVSFDGSANITVASATGGFTVTGGVTSVTSLTASSTITPAQVAGIVGTTTNNDAQVGSVGEFIESEVLTGAQVALVSATAKNVTSISLTAGDWDVEGNVVMLPTGTGVLTEVYCWVSATSATFPTIPNKGGMAYGQSTFTTGGGAMLATGRKRFSLSGTTTIFLTADAVYTGSGAAAYGYISARRRR